jgi:hypothetical protein
MQRPGNNISKFVLLQISAYSSNFYLPSTRWFSSGAFLRDESQSSQAVLGHDINPSLRMRSPLLNKRFQVCLKILRWRKCNKEHAEQLPTPEDTRSVETNSMIEPVEKKICSLIWITNELLHNLAINLIPQFSMCQGLS